MKHLKIENQKGFFMRGESWMVVTEMTKDDLLNLAHAAVDEADFEMDIFDEASLPNPAHKIIYKKISVYFIKFSKFILSFISIMKRTKISSMPYYTFIANNILLCYFRIICFRI